MKLKILFLLTLLAACSNDESMKVSAAFKNACDMQLSENFQLIDRKQNFADFGNNSYSETGKFKASQESLNNLKENLENNNFYLKSLNGDNEKYTRSIKIDRCSSTCQINAKNKVVTYFINCN